MNLGRERFLADQNIHSAVLVWLRSEGIDVTTVRERIDHRAMDDEILAVANADGFVVLTHDRDFGRLTLAIRSGRVVYARPGHRPPEETIAQLAVALEHDIDAGRPFVLVVSGRSPNIQVRVRYAGSSQFDETADEEGG